METEVDVKNAAAANAAAASVRQGSVRQSAALTRWTAARPASQEQIADATGCGQDLAQHMAGLDLRLDAKTRHGKKQSILFPLFSRQTGGRLEVSAIQFLTDKSDPMDFMGATETRLLRNQEAAVTVLPMIIPQAKDVNEKTIKRPNNLMLVMGGKDALVLNLVTGIETVALPSPRIPHHLAEKWAKGEKHQIWICGAVEWEMKEILTRLQDAGFAGHIRWTGNPLARVMPGAEPEPSEDGKPVLNEMNAEILRDDAWVTYLTGGPDAVKALLAGSVTVQRKPKKLKTDKKAESPAKNAERALNTHRQTGKKRHDQDMYYTSCDDAGDFLNQVLHEGGEHVSGLVATTGTGKTRAIVARMLMDTDHAYIYGAPTNDLAQETYHAALQMQDRMFQEGTLKQKRSLRFHEPRSEENCERWQVVTFLQTENRAPWAQGCQIKDLADGVKGDCPHANQCKNHGYLASLDASKKSEVVFTVHQALTGDSSLLGYFGGMGSWEEGGNSEERLIIVDEYIPMFSRLEMRVDDILKNILAADKRIDQRWIERYAERVIDHKMYSSEERRKMAGDAFVWYDLHYRPVMQGIMAQVAEHADPKKDPKPRDVKISGAWADFMQSYPDRPKWLDQMDGSTLGERPYLVGSRDQWILPRLWLDALYLALKQDLGVFFYDGKLIVGRESGLFKTLLKQGGYLLDATMPQGHQAVIRQFQGGKNGEKKGTIIDVPVCQPFLKLMQVLDGNKHGRASLGKKALPREIGKFLIAWLELLAIHGAGNTSALTHMPIRYILTAVFAGPEEFHTVFSYMDEEKAARMAEKVLRWLDDKGWTCGGKEWLKLLKDMDIPANPEDAREKYGVTLEDVAMLGHWGNDDRGHNRWEQASAMLIWGAPLKTPQEYQIEYHIHRAIMKKHGIELEYWDGSVEKGLTIATNGGEDELDCSFPLPTVADARKYVLSSLNAQIAQGVGRLRGVRRTEANPAAVIMYLGDFPVAAVEGGDYHLPTIAYQTSFQSHLCQVATKESMAVSVISAMEGGRTCLQEICDAVNGHIRDMKLSLPKMGKDAARNLLNRIRSYAVTMGVSLAEAARMLAEKVIAWIMAPSGILAPESFYATPEVYARHISDDPDWIASVAILANILEPLDPSAREAREGCGRWRMPDGTLTTF
ncbi:MAG: hypothetical protein M0Z26_01660 [Acidithiobacillus sp.]|nr:hypothetical protein [Acidithiobacillus sp.]